MSSSGTGNADGDQLSAAERFEAFRHYTALASSKRAAFARTLPFELDAFQMEALEGVESGDSVLVAAPTGAGKTVVGEFATYLAVSTSRRAFYTTPIKALSNQKYVDFCHRFGEDHVGLLTGDTSINPHAPVVVMTTEVLRNMIYAGADLSALDYVVLDEVHYLADRFRGPVWEEVMIQLPRHVSVIALSATVSNAEEFGAWMREVRGSCRIVVSERRPVPLYQHMMVGSALYDLYAPARTGGAAVGNLNPQLLRAVAPGARERSRRRGGGPPRRVSRPEVLISLERAHLLPAIVFIFSRAGCDDAVRSVLHSGVVLTSRGEQQRVRAEVERAQAAIPPEDHAVLGVDEWAACLERGVAAHHAGLLPIMKETVERLFTQGLVKAVFATETLALGINMPARTVVIESLQKWNGVTHVQLTPGEYTQLSGRAGRRGIDSEGHCVVLHRGRIAPEEVAALASKRTYPLRSAFRPTYNMVANLLSHATRAETRDVLETSFAQFQADGAVVGLAQQARRQQDIMRESEPRMRCERGDAREYFELQERLAHAQRASARERSQRARDEATVSLRRVRRGDVLAYRRGRHLRTEVVVSDPDLRFDEPRARTVGADARMRELDPRDARGGFSVVGHMRLDAGLRPHKARDRAQIAGGLRDLERSGALRPDAAPPPQESADLAELERAVRAHPVHTCPDRDEHAVAGHRYVRAEQTYRRLVAAIQGRTSSVATQFDQVCGVLERLGFLRDGRVTPAGGDLRRIFGERDVVVAEAVRHGAWDGLEPAQLASIASVCVYEGRTENNPRMAFPGGPGGPIARAWEATQAASRRIADAEAGAGAAPTPPVDRGLLTGVYAWATGAPLAVALQNADLSGGDFVRWIRQVMDLLDQLTYLRHGELGQVAARARELLQRGVVAWSVV